MDQYGNRRDASQPHIDALRRLGYQPGAATPHAETYKALDDAWDSLVTIGHVTYQREVLTLAEYAEVRKMMDTLHQMMTTVAVREKEWLEADPNA